MYTCAFFFLFKESINISDKVFKNHYELELEQRFVPELHNKYKWQFKH